MQGVRRDFMDMPECAVQKLFVMRCQMHVWRNLVYSQPRNIFVKRDVKLTEPPDAEPHVRWCERSAAKAVSYSIYVWIWFVIILWGRWIISKRRLHKTVEVPFLSGNMANGFTESVSVSGILLGLTCSVFWIICRNSQRYEILSQKKWDWLFSRFLKVTDRPVLNGN